MDKFLLIDFVIKLAYVLVAVLVARATLRWFDKYTGIDFKEGIRKVQEDAKAFSLYVGLRFIGISVLISSII